MNIEYKPDGQEDSIRIVNYLRVLWVRKLWVIGTIIVVVLVQLAMIAQSPKLFTVESIIQLGLVDGLSVEPPIQVVEKINSGAYTGNSNGASAKYLDNTQLVSITVGVEDPEGGKRTLKTLVDNITKNHQVIITAKRDFLNKQMAQVQARQQASEIAFERSIKSGMADSAQFLVLNFIQGKIDTHEDHINVLRKNIDATTETQIVKEPAITGGPAGLWQPRPMTLAAVLGLFIGIFLAFIREWWGVITRRS